MKTHLRSSWRSVCAFTVVLMVLGAPVGPTFGASSSNRVDVAGQSERAAQLASDVGGIANSSTIARAKKEKLISTAVREAVLTATRQLRDPDKILKVALELAGSAAQAAPHFADVISRAVSFAGPVARIDTAATRVRAAAYAAARNPRGAHTANRSLDYRSRTAGELGRSDVPNSVARIGRHESTGMGTENLGPPASEDYAEPRLQFGDNSSLILSAAVGVSHDSNIFLQPTNEVSETITTVTPGAEFRFGDNSLAHGSIAYKLAFTQYANGAAPDSKLGNGGADFGYDNGNLSVSAGASYQQVDQTSRDIASLTDNSLIRRNTLSLDTSVETAITAKTRVQSGAAINWIEYKRSGLIGSKNIIVPLKVYVETTPKLALSAGLSYSKVDPDGDGADGTDLFYNLGLRGSLTSKLRTNFSVGYRTRKVDKVSEGIWGFDGSFNYEATPKTGLSLVMSRNFSISALGESLQSSSYFLNFTSDPTIRWQFTGGIGYRAIDYGGRVFAGTANPLNGGRSDSYWETSLSTSYVFTNWLSAQASWTHRQNSSNASIVEFSDDILSLMVVFQY